MKEVKQHRTTAMLAALLACGTSIFLQWKWENPMSSGWAMVVALAMMSLLVTGIVFSMLSLRLEKENENFFFLLARTILIVFSLTYIFRVMTLEMPFWKEGVPLADILQTQAIISLLAGFIAALNIRLITVANKRGSLRTR